MNIYERKSQWKLGIILFAALIVGASLWYTSFLAGKIAGEEKKKVRIWAEAVENKARLLKYNKQLFEQMANEERKKVELWANAMRRLITAQDIDLFALEVVQNNENVPVILTDSSGLIKASRNVDTNLIPDGTRFFTPELRNKFTTYPPLVPDPLNIIYYRDSKLFTDIRNTLTEYINSFISDVALNSASVPVLFTNSRDSIIAFGNLDSSRISTAEGQASLIRKMKQQNDPIIVDMGEGEVNYVYYRDSDVLRQIKVYPYVQFAIIGIFLLVAYYAFSSARRMEQNKVWVGMSKETAHQLGTPISSLMAWIENLKESGANQEVINEIEKDVNRLVLITERFSKIGSSPVLHKTDLIPTLENSVGYLKNRASKRVDFTFSHTSANGLYVDMSPPLFDWVIENLVKNALDAMEGEGKLTIEVQGHNEDVYIDISDTGKGIPKSNQSEVFKPGFSTKKRGWGLGLSLSKRIVENYHRGKIYVKESTPGKGTTFRIILPKSKSS